MAASSAARAPRRGPAPIASFDHDNSDESSPETKGFRLPEIREDSSAAAASAEAAGPAASEDAAQALSAGAGEGRARSASTPGALATPAAPRIDISRASSSSHQDSRDSSPELALFAGATPGAGELGFREDGALDLRSSTEELAFLEAAPAAPAARRHSRKDSQGSEAALLAVSGRTSRLSSVGSQCSAHSALSAFSRVSRLSVASVTSGVSRSPSPHKMLLETSFCGPKPIETDPEICAAAEERLLEMAKLNAGSPPKIPAATPAAAPPPPAPAVDARDRREVRTEATVECAPAPAAALDEKKQKETKNRARAEERQGRSRDRRDPADQRPKSKSKDIIRIRLKPDTEYDDDDDEWSAAERGAALRPTALAASRAPPRPARDSRTPSPAGAVVSRKSSFCSLFKSRETIASPESPSDAHRRKKSLNEGRSRSRSRDRSTTPTSATKVRGSVLSLFRTPRKSATSPSPSSRDGSPAGPARPPAAAGAERPRRGERLKYYENAKDGIIHIPLRTPPDESGAPPPEPDARPASAPQARAAPVVTPVSTAGPAPGSFSHVVSERGVPKPIQRTVLPDGSIIIPLHSPTERSRPASISTPTPTAERPVVATRVTEAPSTSTFSEGDPASASSLPSPAPNGPTEGDPHPSSPPPDATAVNEANAESSRKRERLVFTTHVGSRDQVFSTQFSITKTPSVTSEISGSFPSFQDVEETRAAASARPPSAASARPPSAASSRPPSVSSARPSPRAATPGSVGAGGSGAASPLERAGSAEGAEARESSESEASSEAAPARGGSDVEQRGLVVQESFEEELPYVPTTLPQERSLALPMVPVRERGGVRVAGVGRPRPPRAPAALAPPPAPPAPAAPAPEPDKLRIRLPRRPHPAAPAARARSGSEGFEGRPKTEWIDFEEVPERRKQPKRIQTLPTAAGAGAGAAAGAAPLAYAAPEDCRCECHARAHAHLPSDACGEHAADRS